MTDYKIFDAAYPPGQVPPGCQGAAGYIGRIGRTPHVWTVPQWRPFAKLRQFPYYVPDLGLSPAVAAAEAVSEVMRLGWARFPEPNTRAILFDFETAEGAADRAWWARCAALVSQDGFVGVAYGSMSTVLELAASDVIAADWDGSAALPAGQTIHGHQYQADVGFDGTQVDYSVFDSWLFNRGGIGPRH
jgi:hypothetical protein